MNVRVSLMATNTLPQKQMKNQPRSWVRNSILTKRTCACKLNSLTPRWIQVFRALFNTAVVVSNAGTATVFYEWRKVKRGDFIESKRSDAITRFFCHYPRSCLKPGEQKSFTFTFRSLQQGVYFEEWELSTEP